MSGQATGWVLRHGPRDRAMRAVLLPVADAANRDGEHAHPGLAAIIEGSLYGRRHVIDTLARLVEEGWLIVEEEGGGRGRATIYAIPGVLHGPPTKGAAAAPSPDANGAVEPAKGCSPDVETVQSGEVAPCIATVETNEEPTGPAKAGPALPAVVASSPHLADALELCRLLAECLDARGEAGVLAKAATRGWVVPMEAMLRLDGREPRKVAATIRWLHEGADRVSGFWRPNIRCPEKLREKYARMAEQYQTLRQGGAAAAALHPPGAGSLGDAVRRVAAQAPNGALPSEAIPATAEELR